MTREELNDTTGIRPNGLAWYSTQTGRRYEAKLSSRLYDERHDEDGQMIDMPKSWYIKIRQLIRRDGRRVY